MSDSIPDQPLPQRHRPTHRPVIESGNRAVIAFVTVCTKERAPLLANPPMHDLILKAWHAATHWQVGRYVISPDHVHLFCAPGTIPAEPLLNWVRFWKAIVAKSAGCGADVLWQKNFWDTQLRRGDSYTAKWEYVMNNPVRHGLVSRAEEWPYQGELDSLRWHA